MGANFNTMTLPGTLTAQQLKSAFQKAQDQDRYENGHSYSGGFGMASGLTVLGTRPMCSTAATRLTIGWSTIAKSGKRRSLFVTRTAAASSGASARGAHRSFCFSTPKRKETTMTAQELTDAIALLVKREGLFAVVSAISDVVDDDANELAQTKQPEARVLRNVAQTLADVAIFIDSNT